ncbi:LPXTG-motif cell wall-anchored protein [Microbacterium testaceum]|uniref:RICIN domain-containing protein n=1 Tax=Microbacterium TaxID=33882 RepID=UPI00278A94DA|nr:MULTISPECIES: RICIN domain-containing protein [Microbacterium]MDQ1112267.1 LPXTG-motif cell wall-anchored protein [Microbacterium testaceum]MDR6097197.1 LPXTG-motif cell wall-anchored protein [Microbacterium sp. SORGH_AS_0454]
MTMKSARLLSMTCAVALAAGAITATAAAAPPPAEAAAATPVRITPNPATASEKPFEGWGTSLVWFANATGNYPADVRQKLFDAVFGDDGLNLNIARYNIGGGNASDVPSYLRPGGAVPGFWNPDLKATDAEGAITSNYADRERYKAAWNPDDPAAYDFTKDSAQRWWLDALKGKITHWEAFSNSPPYFLTQSGYASGGINNATSEQLATADMDKFAGYLVNVVDELEKAHGITFDTIDPFNEPNTNYWQTQIPDGATWPTGGRQEGAHIGPQAQDAMVKALAARLGQSGTTTDAVISAMDETNPGIFATNWNTWSAQSKSQVDQLNVHTYGTDGRQVVRDIAKAADKPLWMSEVEGNWTAQDKGFVTDDIENGLGMAQHIVGDLRELEPDAWVFWQPVEDLYNMEKVEKLNWGSVFIDFDCNAQGQSERRLKDGDADPSCKVLTNEKFNTVRNFTHYIAPGDHLMATDNAQSTAAIDADGQGASIVHVNAEATERTVQIDLRDFGTVAPGATVTPIVTTQSTADAPSVNALKKGQPVAVDAATRTATLTIPAKSVVTFEIDGVSGVSPDAAAFRDGQTVQLSGLQSGLALDGGSTLAVRTPATTTDAARAQSWTVRTIDGEGTNRHRFTLQNGTGKFLASSGTSTALVDADPATAASNPTLQWMASTTDGTYYSILNVAAERVLDVNGASTTPGASVGLWTSNGGGNQQWRIAGTSVVGAEPVTVATAVGVSPTLPSTVDLRYAGRTLRSAAVSWQLDGVDFSRVGTVQVRGTGTDLFGNAFEATATVEVGPYTATRPASVTVPAGSALDVVRSQADGSVQAELSPSGSGFWVPVQWSWDGLTDASFAQTGVVGVTGVATGPSGEKLDARLTVIVTAASERNVAPQSQPSATFTESSQYGVANTINGSSTDKGWSNWRSGTKNEQDTLSYALKQRETLTHVAVQFYRDGNTMSWPATMRVDRRVSGGDWIQGELMTVPTPSSGAPKVDVPVAGAADEVRVVMNARSQTHMIVSEVEIFAAAPAPAGIADLARLTVGDTAVEGFAPDVLDYTVSSTGAAWPTLHALAVDEDASVVVTQPGASESADTARVAALAATGGVGTVQVTAPDGTSRTYSVTVNRTVGVTSVTVTGEPRVGSTLRATVVTDPAEAAAAYSWMRDGVAIDGATGDSYALTAADEGRQITVEATATAAGFAVGTARSAAVVPTAAVSDPGTGGGTDGGSGTPGAGTGSTGPGAGAGNGSPAGSANTGAGSAANGRDLATTGQNTEGVLVLGIGALVLLLLGAGAVVLRRRRSRV